MTQFVGLDLETSGSDVDRGHVIIEIGIALPNGRLFESRVGGWKFGNLGERGPAVWDYEAQGVHKIARSELYDSPGVFDVDMEAANWLDTNIDAPRGQRYMVGWNVAGFDRKFLDRYMRSTARSFSYRTVDLNAILFAVTEAGMKRRPSGTYWKYDTLKKEVKAQAASRIVGDNKWHSAGFDALASIYAFEALTTLIHNEWRCS